jgi:exodeoxyribonuclease V alpha subunit
MMFHNPAVMLRLAASTLFSEADLYQARFAASLTTRSDNAARDLIATLTALVSLAVREGHVCLDLSDPKTRTRLTALGLEAPAIPDLLATEVISLPGGPGLLVLKDNHLYFARFFHDEEFLGKSFLGLAASPAQAVDLLSEVFGTGMAADAQPDWQDVAIFAALRSRFCVISGGPGTGKTYTVAKILTLAAEMHRDQKFIIRLAAPTGKAAGRMSQSLSDAFPGGVRPAQLTACLPDQAQTVHRLLGWQPGGRFRYHRGNPLPLDMLVVDEVSMLDMELSARLMEALPDHARLVLLGDRNQLASVEAGAVMANLCSGKEINRFSTGFVQAYAHLTGSRLPVAENPAPLTDHVVELQKSWRFGPDSGIAALSTLVRDGRAEDAARLLSAPLTDIETTSCQGHHALATQLRPLVKDAFGALGKTIDPAQGFHVFDALRLLSPVRNGPRGSQTLNMLVREILTGSTGRDAETWYPGRPVMILENDYNLELFNGDVGIALPADGTLRVFFPAAQGFTSFAPARLPRHETCYAMTVHKSQGSEFGHTVLILPEEPCPALGRELLYTALTRARKRFTLIGTPQQIKDAVANPARRDSGLGEMLTERRPQA